MKTSFIKLLIILGITVTSSCNPCADTNCQNGGVCDDGNCNCPDGFAGPSCESTLIFFDYLNSQPSNCVTGNLTDLELLVYSVGNNSVHLTYTCTDPISGDLVAEKFITGTTNGNVITLNTINPTDTTEIWITSGTAEGINPVYAEGVYYYNNVNYNLNWKKGAQTGTCSGTLAAAGG